MNLSLTKEEITSLLQLLDLAVKNAGLQAAQPAMYFVNKLQALTNANITERPSTDNQA